MTDFDDGQHLWGWMKQMWRRFFGKKKGEFRHPDAEVVDITDVIQNERQDWGIKSLAVSSLWAKAQGEGVRVGILDTGCDLLHVDLKDGIKDYADFSGGGDPKDKNGHGTHVAGIIGARAQGMGIVGVAPKCDLYIAKVLGNDGSGSMYSIVRAIDWCIQKKVDVINMSLGSQGPHTGVHKAIQKARRAGIVVVCASGNDGVDKLNEVDWPARYEECIAVGAVRPDWRIAAFTSIGPEVDILAPGANVYSTYLNNSYALLSGTSMATPFVTGVVALLISHYKKTNKRYSPESIQTELMKESKLKYDFNNGFTVIDPVTAFSTE